MDWEVNVELINVAASTRAPDQGQPSRPDARRRPGLMPGQARASQAQAAAARQPVLPDAGGGAPARAPECQAAALAACKCRARQWPAPGRSRSRSRLTWHPSRRAVAAPALHRDSGLLGQGAAQSLVSCSNARASQALPIISTLLPPSLPPSSSPTPPTSLPFPPTPSLTSPPYPSDPPSLCIRSRTRTRTRRTRIRKR